jgi:hypothetical protein
VQNGPGSPAPGSYPSGVPNNGPAAATQAKQSWLATESDDRPVLSCTKHGLMPWRVTVLGENVTVDISYGTSSNIIMRGLLTPIRVTLPGSVDVYARPRTHEISLPAHVEVTCIPVTSGCCDSECRKVVSGNAVNLDPLAVRFVALEASVVRVGPADTAISVTLATLQEVSLVAGSALTSGGGFLEYEP